MIITTKYIGPTNTRPARVQAKCLDQKYVLPWDHSLNAWQNHWAVAKKLCEDNGVKQVAFSDSLDRTGYVFMPTFWVQDVESKDE